MKQDRASFILYASPRFRDVACPIHGNYMKELQNGWFGNPVWWCRECKKPYQLELHAMRKWNQEAVDKQLTTPLSSSESDLEKGLGNKKE